MLSIGYSDFFGYFSVFIYDFIFLCCSLYDDKQAAKFRIFSKQLAKAACAVGACMVFNLGNKPSTRKNARQIHSLL